MKCCVPTCPNNRRNGYVRLFSFPKNRKQKWCEILKLDVNSVVYESKICMAHFTNNDFFQHNTKIALKPGVNPTPQQNIVEEKSKVQVLQVVKTLSINSSMDDFLVAVQKYFSRDDWNQMESEKQRNYANVYYIYISCIQLGINVVRPSFMDAQYQRDANLGHQDIAVNQFCQVLIVNAHHDQIQKRKILHDIRTTCKQCKYKAKSKSGLVRHMQTVHATSRNYKCNQCNKKFAIEQYLENHIKNIHESNKTFYKCPKCQFSSLYPDILKRHVLRHDGMKTCKICMEMFRTSADLQKHTATVHPDSERILRCPECDRTFFSKGALKCHAMKHWKDFKFECEVCGQKMKTQVGLKTHMLVHNPVMDNLCDQCGQTFKKPHLLQVHIKEIHLKTQIFKCPVCPYETYQARALNTHKFIHRTEKIKRRAKKN